jgi:hypothetical protein
MATHVKALGILHIVFGALGILFGLILFLFFGGLAAAVGMTNAGDEAFVAIPILGGIGSLVFIVFLVLSLPSLIVGIGLLQFRPWGRILGIVLSALHLFNVPFGTALGVYGLWVLLSTETERLFRRNTGPAEVLRA